MDALGFDPGFLGTPCPLPEPAAGRRIRELEYTHFTVLLDTERRLAAATGVNIDGASLLDLGRGDDWHLDERVPADEQTGPAVYARNDLDRGHLVRRRDPVWGADASAANVDTFSYTNAAPQAAEFNQSKKLWNGLEDYVLAYAESYDQRLSVFTGPVFGDADPEYRGVRIPLRFWKIACWAPPPTPAPSASAAPRLAASAYLLDQTPQLDDVDLETASTRARATDAPPPLGPYRTFQLPVADVASLTELDLGPLEAADVYVPMPTASGAPPEHPTWRQLTDPAQLRF